MTTLLCIQARMGSSRLPGKVLLEIKQQSILSLELSRVTKARLVDKICVITSILDEDDEIEKECQEQGISCFRGSPNDLLDRHYQCSLKYDADIILKIPSDCPFMDPFLIDYAISSFKSQSIDYLSNYHPPTFPDGMDIEVFSFQSLQRAWQQATRDHEREHTTPFIWDNPDKFKLSNFRNPYGNMFMTHRWCLDYPADYEFFVEIFNRLPDLHASFLEILNTYEDNPELQEINSHLNGVNWYRNSVSELKTIDNSLFKDEPNSLGKTR